MPKLMRLVVIASALVAGLCTSGAADPPQPISAPQSDWADQPVRNAYETQSRWPAMVDTGQRAIEPPRTLPTAYAAPGGPAAAVSPAPAPLQLARPASAQQPIKLPPAGAQPGGGLGENLKPLVTGGTSLAIVLGLFLVVVWTVRRGSPRAAGLVPSEAVEVLGRVPIAGRQQAHLVRCGNKIVLVSVTASGMEPLTEISDPMEVDRLEGICRQSGLPGKPLKQFLSRFGSQGSASFPDEGPDAVDFRHLEVGNRREI